MGGFGRGIGGRGTTRYFSAMFHVDHVIPKHTNKIRISGCSVTGNHPFPSLHYRAESSPLRPNRINYFPLYFGEVT